MVVVGWVRAKKPLALDPPMVYGFMVLLHVAVNVGAIRLPNVLVFRPGAQQLELISPYFRLFLHLPDRYHAV